MPARRGPSQGIVGFPWPRQYSRVLAKVSITRAIHFVEQTRRLLVLVRSTECNSCSSMLHRFVRLLLEASSFSVAAGVLRFFTLLAAPASWGTESRLRFLNFATFRSAVDTADSANSPARVKTGGRQGSVVGRGRFELPTMRPRKGFRV